jgi:hypothetical protein
MATQRKRVSNADRKPLTRERLAELLAYDPETGEFSRVGAARPQSAHYVNKPVGYIKPGSLNGGGGYRMMSLDGKTYRAHRLAWLYMTGEWPDEDIDHINGERADNRWSNLRAASRWQNIHNMGMRDRNTSGLKGASYDHRRKNWRSQITVNGKHHFLGRFDTAQQAADAYAAAADRMVGEFARAA